METHKDNSELNWILAAGIVGADIGTSVFYGTGILFPIVGYLAPIFVLIACFTMWIFKRTYEEGLAISPYNGGAYSMILRSLGRRIAIVAGALTFVSYLATAAVSSLSGSYYFSSIFPSGFEKSTVVLISFIPVVLFTLLNTRGIKEPAKLVTGICIFHFILLGIISIWGVGYIIFHWEEIHFSKFTNFFKGPQEITFSILAYGFATSFLGITGFESAAQIVETLKQPTLETVRKLYRAVIILVSLTAPAISVLCLVILTPEEVEGNLNYLLSGLSQKIGGSFLLFIIVIDATLTLFAATNTAFVGFIGLASTMAKNGNLPQVFLKKVQHIFPKIEGYPVIAFSMMVAVMLISSFVAGTVEITAKVYEISFLGVMVSFALGTILLRNQKFKKKTPLKYLSRAYLKINKIRISLPPLITALVLGFAIYMLVWHAHPSVLLLFVVLFTGILLLMVYYRWGMLEKRLVTHTDLRLGLGNFRDETDNLPADNSKFILCVSSYRIRKLINKTIHYILEKHNTPFELILFYAEDDSESNHIHFYEILQRVVSQQIAPLYQNKDIILTVRITPNPLLEGLGDLIKTVKYQNIFFGVGHDQDHSYELKEEIENELEIKITSIY